MTDQEFMAKAREAAINHANSTVKLSGSIDAEPEEVLGWAQVDFETGAKWARLETIREVAERQRRLEELNEKG